MCVHAHTVSPSPGPCTCVCTLVSPSLGLCACVCAHALVSPSLGLYACAHAHTHMLPQWWVGIGFVEWAGSHLESLGRPDWHMLKYRRWKDSGQRDQFVNLIELQTTRKPTGFVWNLLGVLRSAQASSGGQPALWGPQGCSLCTVQGREMQKGLVSGGMPLWAPLPGLVYYSPFLRAWPSGWMSATLPGSSALLFRSSPELRTDWLGIQNWASYSTCLPQTKGFPGMKDFHC